MKLDVLPLAGSTGRMSYLLTDPRTRCCAVVDPQDATADVLESVIRTNGLICEWVFATASVPDESCCVSAFSDRFLCPRTAGPAAPEGSNERPFDLVLEDNQRFTVGHAHGRAWVGAECACYVFDGFVIAGCPLTALSTIGQNNLLRQLDDQCHVLLHRPLDSRAAQRTHRSSLGELRGLGALLA